MTIALAAALAGTPAALSAQQEDPPHGAAAAPGSRVRPLDAAARRVIERAVAVSPTVARMIDELEGTDLIVGVQTCPLPKLVSGDARVVAAAGGVRHVRIRLAIPRATSDLVVVLGHELRHAIEIAAMPGIRDGESLVRAYRQMGATLVRKSYFETDAALEAGRVVAQELRQARR
jgi:hypothetical protein